VTNFHLKLSAHSLIYLLHSNSYHCELNVSNFKGGDDSVNMNSNSQTGNNYATLIGKYFVILFSSQYFIMIPVSLYVKIFIILFL